MLANIEVVAFHSLLGILDGLGHHPVLDLLPLDHTQPFHESGDLFRTEDPHEIVFEAEEEPGTTRITLATRTAPELVIDTTALVPLCTQDM